MFVTVEILPVIEALPEAVRSTVVRFPASVTSLEKIQCYYYMGERTPHSLFHQIFYNKRQYLLLHR